MSHAYRIPLTLDPQPEGGFVVTSDELPELVTEGDTVEDALAHAREAFQVVLDIYEDRGQPLPPGLLDEEGEHGHRASHGPIRVDQYAIA